jgi:PAS domain S-box-containing protein
MESGLSRVVDALPGFVWTALPDGRIDMMNQSWSEYTGLAVDASCGGGWQAAVHPEDLPRLLAGWRGVPASRAPVESDVRLRGADGSYRWFSFRAHPMADASGQVVKWCGLSTDIDDRVRAEEARRASERKFRRIVDGLPVLLSTATPDGELEQANRHYLEYFGAPLEELKAREAVHGLHPDDRERVLPVRRAAIEAGRPYEIECRRRRADGVYRWFYLRAFPLHDAEGRITQWYRLQTDIEDQKQAEAQLAGEKLLLAMIASGHPMSDTLAAVCRLVESTANGCYCSIVLVDRSGEKLQEAIAPGLPAEFNEAVRGWPLQRIGGPCVMAARDKVQVIMADVASDARWRNSWRTLAQAHGLRSCWSTPVVSQAGKVLGTFALYQREPGSPKPSQLELIAHFTHIASIAIERAQRDAALRESEARLAEAERELQRAIDNIPARVGTYNADGSHEFVNAWVRKISGVSSVDDWRAAIHPDDVDLLESKWRACVASGEPFEMEYRSRADGGYRWYVSRRVPARDESGKVIRWYAVNYDIEDRKRAEDALRQSEARRAEAERELQLTIDNIPAFVTVFRPDGEREYVNKTWRDNTGLQLADIQERGGWRRIVHPDDQERSERLWREAVAAGRPLEIEQRIRRHDGQYRWHLGRRVPLRDESGNILRWYSVAVDIEDQKRADEALRQSEARLAEAERELQRTIDSVPMLVATYRSDGSRIFVNQTWRDYSGLTHDSAMNVDRLGTSIAHPADAERFVEEWRMALAAGTPLKTEIRLRRADGEYRWHAMHRVPARDEAGAVVKWYSVAVDIEERRRAEEAVLQSEARLAEAERELRLMLDSIPTITWRSAPNGYVQHLNRRWFDYTGTTPDQVQGWRWKLCIHPDDVDQLVEVGNAYVATGKSIDGEARVRRHDGAYRWFLFRPAPVRDETGNVVGWYGAITDIEDRKRAEEELRRSETLLAEGQRLSLTGTFSWRVDTDEVTFSQELHRIFEFGQDGAVTLERLRERTHPEDRALMDERVRDVRAGRNISVIDVRLRMPDERVKYLRILGRAIRHQDGRLEFLGAIQDVTQGQIAEAALDKMRSELAHVTRIMSFGALTASIAHEVNQPLAGIVTNASTCLRMLAADPPNIEGARETARRTIRDGNRAADVITRLRALFSKKATATETVDLNEATREVLTLVFSDLLRNRVGLQVELNDDHPLLVTGDRVQIQQVILNLVRNASDAMSDVHDRPRSLLVTAQEEEGCARLTVKDAGAGFEPQSAERIFDAFYTTKNGGMGIGLSVSRSIIENHGGRLWAETNEGPGARFTFVIPLQDGSAKHDDIGKTAWAPNVRGGHDVMRNR